MSGDAAGLPATASVKLWRAPIWEPTAYATNYDTFRGRRGPPKQPLEPVGPRDSTPPLPSGIDAGSIPSAADWAASVAAAAERGFGEPPAAATPVSEPDVRLRAEKGWHWEGLEELAEGGEPAFQAMLGAYVRGEPLPRGSSFYSLSVRMLAAAERLEQIPGNTSGAGPRYARHPRAVFLVTVRTRQPVSGGCLSWCERMCRFGTRMRVPRSSACMHCMHALHACVHCELAASGGRPRWGVRVMNIADSDRVAVRSMAASHVFAAGDSVLP